MIKMKVAFVLSLVVVVVVAQRGDRRFSNPTPRPADVTEAPPRCSEDAFSIIRRSSCRIDCLIRQVGGNMDGCTLCNRTCNRLSLADNEPDSERNQLGCRVNATIFATLARCHRRCVERRVRDGCFMCNRQCNATDTTREDQDECGDRERSSGDQERRCGEGSLCLLEGTLNRCIRMPRNGDSCERDPADQGDQDQDSEEELDDSDLTPIEGVRDRLRAFTLRLSAETEVPCMNGSYCSQEGQCAPIEGPCINITRRAADAQVACDEEGNFRPLQCRRMDDGTHSCRCVHPRNGSMVPNTMRTGLRQRNDAPDCESRVFRFCNYHQAGRNYTIRHGENFVDRQNCTRCRCNDGRSTSCRVDSRVNCQALNPGETPQNCRRRNIEIQHGTSRMVGRCNQCGCNNGRLICTDIEECEDEGEEDDDQERRCKRCQNAPQRLVCGRDGRTFLSRCIAMNCSGLRDVDILDGPCSRQPTCRLFPCQPGLTCIPLGGRSCLRKEGCTDDERRICVNRTALRCRVFNEERTGFDTDRNNTVCGSDGNTYNSFCHLIQMAPPSTRIAHAGRCDREECRGGQICGTDGVTYNSTCHLRSQSANAQVDYRGECEDTRDRKPWEVCRSIRDNRQLCENTRETCTRRVLSKDGCCPICGGITTLAIDRDALDEYSRATDSEANLDAFMARMTRGDIIPSDVRRRCTVEVSHVRNSTQTNIEVKIIAKNKSADSDFCHNGSLKFTEKINNATNSTSGGTVVNSTLPVEVSFARAAVSAPLVENIVQDLEGNGALSVTIPSSFFIYLVLLGAAFLALLLY